MARLTTDEFRELSRLYYERRIEHSRTAMQLQGDYGKWLVASLLLTHGGAFVFLAQGEEFGQRILAAIHWWLVAGLFLALITGFVTWLNWSLHWRVFDETTSPDMIYDTERWPKDHKLDPWIDRTFYGAIVFGLLSAGCIFGAAIAAPGV